MTTVSASTRLPVNADKAWQLIGGFHSLPDWLPFIVRSESMEGGRVRALTTAEGTVVIERLEAFDNKARTYTYSISEGPFPVTDYLATLQLAVVGENETLVTWSGSFTPAGISDKEAEALFRGIYEGGLTALKANF
jgi:hypothetical protein